VFCFDHQISNVPKYVLWYVPKRHCKFQLIFIISEVLASLPYYIINKEEAKIRKPRLSANPHQSENLTTNPFRNSILKVYNKNIIFKYGKILIKIIP